MRVRAKRKQAHRCEAIPDRRNFNFEYPELRRIRGGRHHIRGGGILRLLTVFNKKSQKEENMSFKEMVESLKEQNEGNTILIRNGQFYIAIGSDALFLHRLLGLKCTCFSKGVCKVGIPITSIDKYVSKLINSGYRFSIYDFDGNTITEKEGGISDIENAEVQDNLGCEKCIHYKVKKNDDKYKLALLKFNCKDEIKDE